MDSADFNALILKSVCSGYGSKPVIFDVDMRVEPGEIVAILGHNGAGKTTLLKTIFGMLRMKSGSILFCGEKIRASARQNRKWGMSFVPSEQFVFSQMTVADNLALGAAVVSSPEDTKERASNLAQMFPVLTARQGQLAGTLSGGQQRMLILAMSLMAAPRLLLLDEPSLGLAPVLVEQIFEQVRSLANKEDLRVILVEQNADAALRIADTVCIMRSGRIINQLAASEMTCIARTEWWKLF